MTERKEIRDLPETLKPVTGQGVGRHPHQYPADTTPPQSGAPGTGIDITSDTMPTEGIVEVHDTDEDMLERERRNSAEAAVRNDK